MPRFTIVSRYYLSEVAKRIAADKADIDPEDCEFLVSQLCDPGNVYVIDNVTRQLPDYPVIG